MGVRNTALFAHTPGVRAPFSSTQRASFSVRRDPSTYSPAAFTERWKIRASIEAFGFTNPVLADPEGHIIAGHGRLQAARLMGLAELPVITLSGLSETQKRTLRIADNKIALNAGWDLENSARSMLMLISR